MQYCEAKLDRAGVAGLGNRLFPWARCQIYSHLHGSPMLATRWFNVPIGTLIRWESDLRTYTNLFTRRNGDIAHWRGALVKMRAKRLAEPQSLSHPVLHEGGVSLVVFQGIGQHFQPLIGWNALIRQELLAITKPRWRELAEAFQGTFIGIHVRRGDFQRPGSNQDFSKTDNMSTPLAWFVESLKSIRSHLSGRVPAVITSDGTPEELSGLLNMENVRLASTGSAIGDLLVLSRSSLLLASGSSFSAWAAFLGQMPTLCHPGQGLARLFQLEGTARQFIGEFDPSDRVSGAAMPKLRGLVG